MSIVQLNPAPSTASEAARPPRRSAGLFLAPKGHMTPCLAFVAFFLVVDVVACVVPFYLARFTDSPWGSPDRMAFLARAMASALAFGFLAAVTAERRGHSSWWFLAGHAGFPLALVFAIAGMDLRKPGPDPGFFDPRGPAGAAAIVIAAGFLGTAATLVATRRVRPEPAPMTSLQARICRLMHQWGNIWFGITLMAAIGTTVAVGTFVENRYGTKAAQYLVYRSPWFGAIFFTGGISMLSATFRKYPFRLEQAGWLTVHTGLALVVIGGMTSFLSSVDGDVTIREGNTVESFRSSIQTRLSVDQVVLRPNGTRTARPLLRTIADFDLNPTHTEPDRVWDLDTNDGESPIRVVADRYYAMGEAYTRWTDGGRSERLGIEVDLVTPKDKSPKTLRLDEIGESNTSIPFGSNNFELTLLRAPPRMRDALLRAAPASGSGRIVVTDESGREIVAIPVEPPAGERRDGAPATLGKTVRIPETGIDVKLLSYFDNMRPARNVTGIQDASPGNPVNPAVMLELAGPDGVDARSAMAWFDHETGSPKGKSGGPRYPYRIAFAYEPKIDLDGPALVFVDVDGRLSWIFVSSSGERTSGDVVAGEDLPLPMPAFRLKPKAVFRHLEVEDGYAFKGYKAEAQVARFVLTSSDGTAAAPVWLPLGERKTIALGDRTLTLSWTPTIHPLGFSLKLNDFHRDFYPGTTEESSFESYCLLRHPSKFPQGEDIKIDMNHPLRLDGWRLFQSRFGGDGRTTILQVNRDPGLAITYPACAVVLLGLVVVFFMKPTLRLKRLVLERNGAKPGRHLAWAFGSVAAVGVGPLLFGLYAATHEALGLPLSGWPSFVFGVTLLIVVPISVVWTYVRPLSRRLTAALSAGSSSRGAT